MAPWASVGAPDSRVGDSTAKKTECEEQAAKSEYQVGWFPKRLVFALPSPQSSLASAHHPGPEISVEVSGPVEKAAVRKLHVLSLIAKERSFWHLCLRAMAPWVLV